MFSMEIKHAAKNTAAARRVDDDAVGPPEESQEDAGRNALLLPHALVQSAEADLAKDADAARIAAVAEAAEVLRNAGDHATAETLAGKLHHLLKKA